MQLGMIRNKMDSALIHLNRFIVAFQHAIGSGEIEMRRRFLRFTRNRLFIRLKCLLIITEHKTRQADMKMRLCGFAVVLQHCLKCRNRLRILPRF